MLNDQNSSSSLILSAENLLRCIFSGVISNATKLLDIRPGRNFSLNFDSRNRQPVCEKKKGKIKKKKRRRIEPRERNFVHCIYYLFIYLFAVNGNRRRREEGRGCYSRFHDATRSWNRLLFSVPHSAPLFLSLKFHFIDDRSCTAFLPGIRIPFTSRTNDFRVFAIFSPLLESLFLLLYLCIILHLC